MDPDLGQQIIWAQIKRRGPFSREQLAAILEQGCRDGHRWIVQAILRREEQMRSDPAVITSCLGFALSHSHLPVVRYLLQVAPIQCDSIALLKERLSAIETGLPVTETMLAWLFQMIPDLDRSDLVTALNYACERGYTLLYQQHTDLLDRLKQDDYPRLLGSALQYRRYSIAEPLLARVDSPEAIQYYLKWDDFSHLDEICSRFPRILEMILENNPHNLVRKITAANLVRLDQISPFLTIDRHLVQILRSALCAGQEPIVQFLLEQHSDLLSDPRIWTITRKHFVLGKNLFEDACRADHLHIAQTMWNARPEDTRSASILIPAYYEASVYGSVRIADWIAEICDQIDPNQNNDRYFLASCRGNHPQMLDRLVRNDPELLASSRAQTFYQEAFRYDAANSMQWLVDRFDQIDLGDLACDAFIWNNRNIRSQALDLLVDLTRDSREFRCICFQEMYYLIGRDYPKQEGRSFLIHGIPILCAKIVPEEMAIAALESISFRKSAYSAQRLS